MSATGCYEMRLLKLCGSALQRDAAKRASPIQVALDVRVEGKLSNGAEVAADYAVSELVTNTAKTRERVDREQSMSGAPAESCTLWFATTASAAQIRHAVPGSSPA